MHEYPSEPSAPMPTAVATSWTGTIIQTLTERVWIPVIVHFVTSVNWIIMMAVWVLISFIMHFVASVNWIIMMAVWGWDWFTGNEVIYEPPKLVSMWGAVLLLWIAVIAWQLLLWYRRMKNKKEDARVMSIEGMANEFTKYMSILLLISLVHAIP